MEHIKIASDMFDANLRCEQIIHLASQCFDETTSHVEDAFSMDWDVIWEAIGVEPQGEERHDINQTIVDSRKFGFLVQMATPVLTMIGKVGWSLSWGHYSTKWFYAESLDEIYKAAFVWEEKHRKECKSVGNATDE